MAKWMQAQGSETFLTRAHWEQMWAPARLNDGSAANYGFGWNIRSAWSRKRVDHAGGIEGFATGVTRFIDDDLSIVFLMNLEGSSGGRIGQGLFGIYLPPTRYNPPKPIADADAKTTGWLREVTSALSQGTGDRAWYTPKVQEFYFPDRIKARKLAFSALGSLQSFELIEAGDDRGRDKRTYRATFGTTPFLFSYWLTPAGKIDDVDFRVE